MMFLGSFYESLIWSFYDKFFDFNNWDRSSFCLWLVWREIEYIIEEKKEEIILKLK